jgi:glycine/serine hydroxymethyltransferase
MKKVLLFIIMLSHFVFIIACGRSNNTINRSSIPATSTPKTSTTPRSALLSLTSTPA